MARRQPERIKAAALLPQMETRKFRHTRNEKAEELPGILWKGWHYPKEPAAEL